MSRRPRTVIECRDYALPPEFPLIVLTGDMWRISDIRSPVLHFHNNAEIGVCHSDSGILEFQDASYPFKAGDVTFIAGGVPHTTYSSPDTASKWSYLMVDAIRIIDPLAAVMEIPSAELYKDLRYNSRLVISQEEDPVLSILAMEIVREMQEQRTNYRHCVRGLLDALFDKLSRYTPESSTTQSDRLFPIAPALRYIENHYMESFRIDELAAQCKMSASYFRRVFTETMGLGPLEYLNQTRIMRACTMLQNTDFSILEICERVGFCSLSSFNRHFSAIMGQPPTGWRHHVNADRPLNLQRYTGWMVPPKMGPHRGKKS